MYKRQIVTMEDLVEEIMGDIEDEYDEDDEAQIEKLDEHTYVPVSYTHLDVYKRQICCIF